VIDTLVIGGIAFTKVVDTIAQVYTDRGARRRACGRCCCCWLRSRCGRRRGCGRCGRTVTAEVIDTLVIGGIAFTKVVDAFAQVYPARTDLLRKCFLNAKETQEC